VLRKGSRDDGILTVGADDDRVDRIEVEGVHERVCREVSGVLRYILEHAMQYGGLMHNSPLNRETIGR